jgi:mono/diheme cytochrome c family protein
MDSKLFIYLAGVTLASLILTLSSIAQTHEPEIIAGGEIEYQRHCASCHGVDGKGRGYMAKFLTMEPLDLTQLAKRNGDKFPFWRVYRIIDGREEVRGHGSREMPIWGRRFQAEVGGSDPASRATVSGRILGLAFYLDHIQQY